MATPTVDFGTLRFGVIDPAGVEWICVDLEGWADLPDTSAQVQNRSLDHGGFAGDAYYGPRVLNLEGVLVAPDQQLLQTALHTLRAEHYAALQNEIPLYVDELDGPKYLLIRVGKPSMTVRYLGDSAARVHIEVAAAWPVKRNQARQLIAEAGEGGVGRRYPRGAATVNGFRRYGSPGTTGDVYAENLGNAPVRPQFLFTGPVNRPEVYAPEQNRKLSFNINLADGDVLAVDADLHTVLLNEVGNRRHVLTTDSAWFDLLPGENRLQYRSTSNTGTMTVQYCDGWW